MVKAAATAIVVLWSAYAGLAIQSASAQQEPAPGISPADQALAQDKAERFEIPAIDLEAIQQEDQERLVLGMAPRYAVPHGVIITPETHGTWEEADDGGRTWRLIIVARKARSINLGFDRYLLPDGAQLRFYSLDERFGIRPFTHVDNESHGELWTPIVPSDEVVVELTVPAGAADEVQLRLAHIGYGYRGFGTLDDQQAITSGSCNVDVVCPEGDDWRDDIPSVGVISTGGGTFCTGFMVNNTAYDLTPYFMTANHCGISSGNAPSLVVYWNYENSWCRPPGSQESGGAGDGNLTEFNTGSFFRSSYGPSDFTLVELDDDPDPEFGVSYAGWNRSDGDATSAVGIHHPNTDEKRISFEFEATTTTTYLGDSPPGDGTHVRVEDWDAGTTEPGSSGSPLFDQNHRVIGQLHGGYAACGNDRADWYGRISVSWTGGGSPSTRLLDWLDEEGTGDETVDTVTGLGMIVSPSGTVEHIGPVGGPFTNERIVYTISNPSPDEIDYEIHLTESFGILLDGGTSPISGSLAAQGGSREIVVTLGADIDDLPEGIFAEEIIFEDLTNQVIKPRPHTVEVGQTMISVSPDDDFESGGPLGGPFEGTIQYRVTSERPTAVTVEVEASESWISINGEPGPLMLHLEGTGASEDLTISISEDAEQLPAGVYEGVVSFSNLTHGRGDSNRSVTLEVGRVVYISDDTPLPIRDNSTTISYIEVADHYCIGDVNVDIDLSHTFIGDLIVELTSPAGTTVRLHDRTGGSDDDIVRTYDDEGEPPDGPGRLSDLNLEPADGVWILTVSDNAGQDEGDLNSWGLRIVPLGDDCPTPEMIYQFDLSTDPGWDTQGEWAWGQPTGGGGEYGAPDPTAGFTGPNVYGYNLAGDYTNDMPEFHLTTTAIDCSALTNVKVSFARWLNVETDDYDHAYFRASNDGSTWTTIWENSSEITDTAWLTRTYNIGEVADEQSTVYLRWTMGDTDGSWLYSGWNIDDVEIWALTGGCTRDPAWVCDGDTDGDGQVNPVDSGLVQAAFGSVDEQDLCNYDVDCDGQINPVDSGIVQSLFGTCAEPREACP